MRKVHAPKRRQEANTRLWIYVVLGISLSVLMTLTALQSQSLGAAVRQGYARADKGNEATPPPLVEYSTGYIPFLPYRSSIVPRRTTVEGGGTFSVQKRFVGSQPVYPRTRSMRVGC